MEAVSYSIMQTPVGDLGLVVGSSGVLMRIDFLAVESSIPHWTDHLAALDLEPVHDDRATETIRRQLQQYFDHQRNDFDLPLDLRGGSFEQSVWQALTSIPYGVTWSYGQVADKLGDSGASRAVGHANGQNPIPIIIPCHRVIGSDGSLVGYGGGLAIKEWLLVHEGALLCPLPKPK